MPISKKKRHVCRKISYMIRGRRQKPRQKVNQYDKATLLMAVYQWEQMVNSSDGRKDRQIFEWKIDTESFREGIHPILSLIFLL